MIFRQNSIQPDIENILIVGFYGGSPEVGGPCGIRFGIPPQNLLHPDRVPG
jgi:hypothetical protein